MKLKTITIALVFVLFGCVFAEDLPVAAEYISKIEVQDDVDGNGGSRYTIFWNEENLPSFALISIARSPRDEFITDFTSSLEIVERDLYPDEAKDESRIDPFEESEARTIGKGHISTFVLGAELVERARIEALGEKKPDRAVHLSSELQELIDFLNDPEGWADARGKRELANKIVKESGLPLFPKLTTHPSTLDYSRKQLEVLYQRTVMVLVRLQHIYADAIEREFTKEELEAIYAFISSEAGGRFFDLLNFEGKDGDLLEKSIDEIRGVISEGIHPGEAEPTGAINSEAAASPR